MKYKIGEILVVHGITYEPDLKYNGCRVTVLDDDYIIPSYSEILYGIVINSTGELFPAKEINLKRITYTKVKLNEEEYEST